MVYGVRPYPTQPYGVDVAANVTNTTLQPGAGSVVFTGLIPSVVSDTPLAPGAGTVAFSGFSPTVNAATALFPGAGAIAFAGFAPTVVSNTALALGAGQITFTGFAPTVTANTGLTPGAGLIVFTGFTPTVVSGGMTSLYPGAGQIKFTGFAPTVIADTTLYPGAGQIKFTGFQPTYSSVIPPTSLYPGAGAITFTGFQPTVLVTPSTATMNFLWRRALTIPNNTIFADGVTTVMGSQLNTMVQTVQTASQLRAFIAATGMVCYLQGISAPGDGLAGDFYWAVGSTFVDDNYSTIVPSGASGYGAWIRATTRTVGTDATFQTLTITGSAHIANPSFSGTIGGLGTMAFENSNNVAISGGAIAATIDNSPIGQTTPNVGTFTSLSAVSILTGAGGVNFPSGALIYSGTGSPTFAAVTGSIYLRQDGSLGASVYIREDGGIWSPVTALSDVPTFPAYTIYAGLSSPPATQAGLNWFDSVVGGMAYYNLYGYEVNPGQEVTQAAVNATGTTIAAGVPVYISGGSGSLPSITPATNNGTAAQANVVGITGQSIANGATGTVVILGIVTGVNTSSFGAGDTLYLGTSGTITNVQPNNPSYAVRVGFVVTAATSGIVFTSVRNIYTLQSNIFAPAPKTINAATYTIAATDYAMVFTSTSCTVTLPTPSANIGRVLIMKNITYNTVTSASSNVVPLSSATAGTAILTTPAGHFAYMQCDGTNWVIMQSN